MEGSITYWLLTTEFPPFFGGGISTYCRETVRMLTVEGYKVSVFLPDRTVSGIICHTDSDQRIIRFNPFDYKEKAFLGYETLVSFAFAQVLDKFIREEGPPFVVESQEYNGIAYFTLLYKKLLYPSFKDIKVIITVHAPSFVCLPYNQVATSRIPYFWIGEMEKFCLKAADLVIAPSDYMCGEIQARAPEVQLKYVKISNPYYSPERSTVETGNIRNKEFVFYGKTSPLKGIFELLKQFDKLWEQDPELKLRLVGGVDYYYHPEGKLMGDIIKKKYAKYLERGQLIIEGEIPPAELKGRIINAHAVIIPSQVDNLPYAVIECMALGKIVLASTSGGHKELLKDGDNGFLFSHEDPESFKEKIASILALDSAALRKMGSHAIESVKSYCDPATVFKKKSALLKEITPGKEIAPSFPFLHQLPGDAAGAPAYASPDHKRLLSVVIPFYNMGEYIEDTIHSILHSTYSAIEIIVVNDGSNEEASLQKLRELSAHSAVRVIHKTNEGLSEARNTGAREAKGEFLAFLDADDMVDPAYYQKALDILHHYDNVYFAGAWVRYFGEGEGIWPCFTPEPPFILYHNMINTSALVYKKSCFLRYGLNDKALLFGMEDYDSLLSLLEKGCSGIAIPQAFFHYRVRKGSMARQFTSGKILYLYQLLANKHNKFYSTFAAEITNLLNSNGQGFLNDNPSLDLHITSKSRIIKKLLGAKGIEYLRKNKRLKNTIIKFQQFLKRK